MSEYEKEMTRLKARKDFERQEEEECARIAREKERIKQEEEKTRQEAIAREEKDRAEYERLKNLGLTSSGSYEQWKKNRWLE